MNQKTRLVKRRNSASSRAFLGSSQKVGGANKGLGEATKSCTRKEHESATNSIARRGQGAIAPCRVKGQRPLWGLGQRPNSSTGDQFQESHQQRRRQRSVPASIFARPQTRPQAAPHQDSVKNPKNTFPRAGTIRPPFSSVRVQGKRSPDIPPPQGETRI